MTKPWNGPTPYGDDYPGANNASARELWRQAMNSPEVRALYEVLNEMVSHAILTNTWFDCGCVPMVTNALATYEAGLVEEKP